MSIWTNSTSGVIGADWLSVTYGNGKFVAVSVGTTILYSTDGVTWNNSTVDEYAFWTSVTYGTDPSGNGKFVAVSPGVNTMSSTDGVTWTNSTNNVTDAYWRSVTYGNGKFVAVSFGTNTMSSTDGVTWTNSTNNVTNANWSCVTYGNDKFVAVSNGVNTMSSTDGVTWTNSTDNVTNASWNSVTYGNDKFVAVSGGTNTMSSTDGVTWTNSTDDITNAFWSSVTYGNGKFVAVSDGVNTMSSSDGVSWTNSTSGVINVEWKSVTYGDSKFVAISGGPPSPFGPPQNKNTMVGVFPTAPTLSDFSIPTKVYGELPFTITDPSSNSDGTFSFASSNTSVATISGSTLTIVGVGSSNVTATQAASGIYTSGTIDASFNALQNSQDNPAVITTGAALLYMLGTTATFADVTSNITVTDDLSSTTKKVIYNGSNDTVTIKRA